MTPPLLHKKFLPWPPRVILIFEDDPPPPKKKKEVKILVFYILDDNHSGNLLTQSPLRLLVCSVITCFLLMGRVLTVGEI